MQWLSDYAGRKLQKNPAIRQLAVRRMSKQQSLFFPHDSRRNGGKGAEQNAGDGPDNPGDMPAVEYETPDEKNAHHKRPVGGRDNADDSPGAFVHPPSHFRRVVPLGEQDIIGVLFHAGADKQKHTDGDQKKQQKMCIRDREPSVRRAPQDRGRPFPVRISLLIVFGRSAQTL